MPKVRVRVPLINPDMPNQKTFSPCSGLVVRSFSKYDSSRKLEKKIPESIIQYKKFKKMYTIGAEFRGK